VQFGRDRPAQQLLGVDLAPGSFANAVAPSAAERWRRHGGYPTKDEVPALRASDQLRSNDSATVITAGRLIWHRMLVAIRPPFRSSFEDKLPSHVGSRKEEPTE
jgi:hypothetical protein